MDDEIFRQKGPGVARGEAVDANPSERSGGGGSGTPIWKSFITNESINKRDRVAIANEQRAIASKDNESSAPHETWGGDNGRLLRKTRNGIEQFDAELYTEDPNVGGFARKSLFDREKRTAAAEYDSHALRLEDPAFKAKQLSKKAREDIELEGSVLAETDPRHKQLKAQLVADDEYRAERADLEQRKYDAKVKATNLGNTDHESWWSSREAPAPVDPVQTAVAQRDEADAADQSAMEEEKALGQELAGGVPAARLQEIQARQAEISQARALAGEKKVEAGQAIEGVKQQAKAEIEGRGFFENTMTALQRGYAGAAQGANVLQGATDATNAQDIADYEKMKQANPASKEFQDFINAEGFQASAMAFIKNPVRIITEVIAESAAQMVPGIALGVAGGSIGGAMTSAPTAGVAAPLTVPVGAAIGAAVGAGSGSAISEYGSAMMQSMQDAGMDATKPESIQEFFSNPEKLAIAREFAIKRGVAIGVFDAASAGLAGKFLKPVQVASNAGQKVAARTVLSATGKEIGAQAGMGAAGEAAGQLASEGRISDGKSLFLEGIAEVGSGPFEVASNLREFGGTPTAPDDGGVAQTTTALRAIDPEAPAPSADEVVSAASIVNPNRGFEGFAEGVRMERAMKIISTEDDASLAAAEEALTAAKASGDTNAVTLAEEGKAKVQGRAEGVRAVLKIAAGKQLEDLTKAELASLGFNEGEKGKTPTPMSDEELAKVGLDDIQVTLREDPETEAVDLIIRDAAIKRVTSILPAAANFVTNEETAIAGAQKRRTEAAEAAKAAKISGQAPAQLSTEQQNGEQGDPATGLQFPLETNAPVETFFDVPVRTGPPVRVQANSPQEAELAVAGMFAPHENGVLPNQAVAVAPNPNALPNQPAAIAPGVAGGNPVPNPAAGIQPLVEGSSATPIAADPGTGVPGGGGLASPLAVGQTIVHGGIPRVIADIIPHPSTGSPVVSFTENPQSYVFPEPQSNEQNPQAPPPQAQVPMPSVPVGTPTPANAGIAGGSAPIAGTPQAQVQGAVASPEAQAIEERYQSSLRLADSWAKNDPEKAGKMRKAAGMIRAAEVRKLTGNLTGKEQQAKAKREASNYTGKPVVVGGQTGKVAKTAFGKVVVAFDNGETRSVNPDEIFDAPATPKPAAVAKARTIIAEHRSGVLKALTPEILSVAQETGMPVTNKTTLDEVVSHLDAKFPTVKIEDIPKPTVAKVSKLVTETLGAWKKNPAINSVLKLDTKFTAKAETVEGSGVHLNPQLLVQEIATAGLSDTDAKVWLDRVLFEELHHLSQLQTFREIYLRQVKAKETKLSFEKWREAYSKTLIQEFKSIKFLETNENGDTVEVSLYEKAVDAYGVTLKAKGTPAWIQVSEINRMILQDMMTGNPTEATKAALGVKEIRDFINQALESLKAFVAEFRADSSNFSKDLIENMDRVEELLKQYGITNVTDQNQSRPRTPKADSAQPAQSKPSVGTSITPAQGGDSSPSGNGGTQQASSNGAGSPLQPGQRVEFEHKGIAGTGVVRLAPKEAVSIYPDSNPGAAILVPVGSVRSVVAPLADTPQTPAAEKSPVALTPEEESQKAYTKLKSSVAKAQRSEKWSEVVSLIDQAEKDFTGTNGFSDQWQNFERYREDAQEKLTPRSFVTPILKPYVPSAPALTPDEQALKDAFSDMVDGLEAAPLIEPDPYQSKGIPRDKRATFMDVADQLYDAGVRTPADLAAKLEKVGGGKLRAYSDAVWSVLRSNYPTLPQASDWAGVYSKINDSNSNDSTPSTSLEPDSSNAGTPNGSGKSSVPAGRGATRGNGKRVVSTGNRGGNPAQSDLQPNDSTSTPERDGSDQQSSESTPEPEERPSNPDNADGSRVPDADGVEAYGRGENDTHDGLVIPAVAPTLAQGGIEGVRDVVDVKKSAPALKVEQAEDVVFVEKRFEKHPGALLTNGTGTGKTFSGLGVVKRALDRGEKHVIIISPSDKVVNDWIDTAREFFGIRDIAQLDGIRDNSATNRVVVTTYANFGQNNELVARPWGLVVTDEAHYLAQAKDGNSTLAQKTHKGLTWHPKEGVRSRLNMELAEEMAEMSALNKSIDGNNRLMNRDDTMDQARYAYQEENRKLEARWSTLNNKVQSRLAELQKVAAGMKKEDRPKSLFLSATPFAYHFSLDYAEGYLFEHGPEPTSTRYNTPSARSKFYMENFGYRMRYGKLTSPDQAAATASVILERMFAEKLKRSGAMRGRMLSVPFDYSRDFVISESAVGNKIDEVMKIISDNPKYSTFASYLGIKDYLTRRYLLEGLKAREAVGRIKAHLALGRKVLVFHDYKKGGTGNPFRSSAIPTGTSVSIQIDGRQVEVNLMDAYNEMAASIPGFDAFIAALDGLESPIDVITREFPDAGIFNGDISPKNRSKVVNEFNRSGSSMNVVLAQRASAKEGISFHDTDAKYQRVFIDIGIAGRPTDAIQGEGRTIRLGMQSNGILEYLTTGTDFERWTFAQTIATRASTAENLAMGENARALLQSFSSGYNDAQALKPSKDQGTGGKQADAARESGDPFDNAVALYFTNQKKTSRNKSEEGVDYFATPEPLGFKMVEWAGIRPGERVLEPSGGHGAIARFFPDSTVRHAVEPSYELAGRLALNAPDTKIHQVKFEDYDVVNKFDAIVMNPPFGTAGKTAMDHLEKATRHLKVGGRIVALIPMGSSMEKRFDKWYGEQDNKAPNGILYMAGEVKLPSVTFERAGTSVSARVVILDKFASPSDASFMENRDVDLTGPAKAQEFFDRLRDISIPSRPTPSVTKTPAEMMADLLGGGRDALIPKAEKPQGIDGAFSSAEFNHTKTGAAIFVARIDNKLSDSEYSAAKSLAKRHGGYYQAYNKGGAIPGFHFPDADSRDGFLSAAMTPGDTGTTLRAAELPASDRDYLELAKEPERNDWRLQQMVDEKAKSMKGVTEAVHGGISGITSFDAEKIQTQDGGAGFYFSTDIHSGHAENYAKKIEDGKVYKAFLTHRNPYYSPTPYTSTPSNDETVWAPTVKSIQSLYGLTNKEMKVFEDHFDGLTLNILANPGEFTYRVARFEERAEFKEFSNSAQAGLITMRKTLQGKFGKQNKLDLIGFLTKHDGIIYKDGSVATVLSPKQIKSADPITRDSKGNIIPLSQRFNPASNSILQTAPLPSTPAKKARDAFNANREKFENAQEQVKALGSGTAGADPKFANPGATPKSRDAFDIARMIDSNQREIKKDRDTHAQGREFLEKYPEEVERLLLESGYGDNPEFTNDYRQHAINLLLNRKAEAASTTEDYEQLYMLATANVILGRDQARAFRQRMDKFLTPAERAHAAIADAIFTPSKKIAARAEVMKPAERKAFLSDEGKKRIAEVEKALAKRDLSIQQIQGKNRDLQLVNSRLEKEVLSLRNTLEQDIIRFVQKGASPVDVRKRFGKLGAEQAKGIIEKAAAEMDEKLYKMLAAGMTMEDILASQRDTLKAAPLAGAAAGMNEAAMRALAMKIRKEQMGIPDAEAWSKSRPLPTARPKKPVTEIEAHPLAANWSRPEFSDHMKTVVFDLKDRHGIMERVEIIRGLAGALGKIDSLTGEKRTKAEAALDDINKTLAKYNTDAKGIFEGTKGIEDYRFDINDVAHVALVARTINSLDADFVDKASEYLYFSMLSGLQTMMVNATAIVPAAWESTVGRGVNMAINHFVKDPMAEQYGEGKYIVRALGTAISRAWSNAQASMAAQHPMFDRDVNAMEVDWDKILGGGSHRMVGSIAGRKGDLIRLPMRLLTATDDFNRTLIAVAEVGTFAYRMAKMKGLKDGSAEMDTFIRQEVNTAGSLSYQMASQKASKAIYSNPLPGQKDPHTGKEVPRHDMGDFVGYMAARLTDAVTGEHDNIFIKALSAALRVAFFPFQRTPFNIIRKGVRHTLNPFSLADIAMGVVRNTRVDGKWQWAIEGDGQEAMNRHLHRAELIERMGQQLQGAVLMTALYALAWGEGDDDDQDQKFIITGSSPFLPTGMAERDARMRSGIGPFRMSWMNKDGSERLGFSYGRIEPVATILAATIDMMKSFKRADRSGKDTYDAGMAAMGGLISQAQDKSFMKGIGDFIKLSSSVMTEPDLRENRKALQFLASRAAMVVPNFIKQPLRESDTQFRDRADGFMQSLMYEVAPIGQKPAKVDPYGKKLTKPGVAPLRPIDPTDIGSDSVNTFDRVLLKWSDKHPDKAWFPSPIMKGEFKHARTGAVVEMNQAQLTEFRDIAGKRVTAMLKRAGINMQNPTELDLKKIKEAHTDARSEAKKLVAFKYSR